jgi:Fe-S-cluster containining protein
MLPRMGRTANERARLCISGERFEEDVPPSITSACPLLKDGRCSCYEARPLMCRMMLSTKECGETGHAEMPSRLLSLTTVCQQLVEDIDRQGWSGYLMHMLPLFENPAFAADYSTEREQVDTGGLRRNRPNPEFLVPPEDRPQIRLWLQDLDERLKQY